MKITPINRMGSFGVYVDNIDMNHMTRDEWLELGRLYVQELVVVCRDIKISKEQFYDWIPEWGPICTVLGNYFQKKYGHANFTNDPATWNGLDDQDLLFLTSKKHRQENIGNGKHLNRIYGGVDESGQALGTFSSGDVFWHSDESALLTFAPVTALLGWSDMGQSATGFLQTIDFYESLPESLRNELDEMVLRHEFQPGKVNANELEDSGLATITKMNFCPWEGLETPFVCTAPNGRKGLHYSINTRAGIKGMSREESNKLFDKIDKMLFEQCAIFDHQYHDGRKDLLFFDNSVVMHRRIGHRAERLAFRTQLTLTQVLDNPWYPWQHFPEYDRQYRQEMKNLIEATGGDLKARFADPTLV
jgi:alpha-ketoglutarate-dependent taurine dioxygenase